MKQAQLGLHELYTTVADINAQEEGLPPAAKTREPAPSTKAPVKRPRDSSAAAAAAPAPSPAPAPAPAVSPAVQASLQQRAPMAPTPTPELHIDDDAGFSTQFVAASSLTFLFDVLTAGVCPSPEKSMLPQGFPWNCWHGEQCTRRMHPSATSDDCVCPNHTSAPMRALFWFLPSSSISKKMQLCHICFLARKRRKD